MYLDKQIVNRAEPKSSNPARGGRLRIRQKVEQGVRLGGLHEDSESVLKRFPQDSAKKSFVQRLV